MSRFRPLHLLVLFVVCASWACEKVPLTSPTGSTISLSTSSNIVPINGSVDITATVIESAGTAVQNGTTVIFSSDFGRLDPAEAKTQNGRATVKFIASGQSGTVKVNAYSGAASTSGGTTSGALTLLVGGAAAGRMTVRAEPPNIPQTGGTVQVFANVTDTNGNALAGAPVTFTIGGTGTGTGILGSASVVTDANGQAQTSLTTNQTTTVTAAVATATTTAVTANVVVNALAAPTVVLTCPATTQSIGVPVTCTVTPTAAGGVAVQNVTINWGDGTGEQPVGNVTGATTLAHTYSSANTYTVTATATDLNSQRGSASASVVVQRVNPTITITGPATATTGVPVTFTVTPPANPPQPITNVNVDFGDGTSRNLGAITGATSFTKTFGSEGGFTVTATVTDASGGRGSSSTGIVVSTSSPGATLTGPSTATLNTTTGAFTVGATASTGTTIRSVVVVDLDNGDRELYRATSGGTFTTTFNATGNHRLEARVTDSTGTTSTARHQVNVQ